MDISTRHEQAATGTYTVDEPTWLAVTAAAGAAPSIHNTQPWRFVVRPDVVELHLDPARVLPVADADGREARISCGAALLNLRVALRAAGVVPVVSVVPVRSDPTLLAVVRPGRPAAPSRVDLLLHDAVPRRRSHRRPFHPSPVDRAVLNDMVYAAGREGAFLHIVTTTPSAAAVASLVRRAHDELGDDPAYRAELAAWTTDDDTRADGVPHSSTGPRSERGGLVSMRDFGPDRHRAERPYEQDPLFAVLSSSRDTPADHVRAGAALQHALLVATTRHVGASILSAPIEVPAVRAALRAELGGAMWPQLLLRLGVAHPAGASPRRPVTETTVFEPAR